MSRIFILQDGFGHFAPGKGGAEGACGGWEAAEAGAWSFLQHGQCAFLPQIQAHPRPGHIMAENLKLFEHC